MDNGQIHTRASRSMAQNYISEGLKKVKPIRLCTPYLHPIRGKHASGCTSCLCTSCAHVFEHILRSWGDQACLQKYLIIRTFSLFFCSFRSFQPQTLPVRRSELYCSLGVSHSVKTNLAHIHGPCFCPIC